MTKCATWIPLGANSRAYGLGQPAQRELAHGEHDRADNPFTLAEAPVSRMVPAPCGSMRWAAACATRKPP
jgi:hypothetical protein